MISFCNTFLSLTILNKKSASRTNAPVVLLLEDDSLPVQRLGALLAADVPQLPAEWGYISLYHGRGGLPANRDKSTLVPLPKNAICGAALIRRCVWLRGNDLKGCFFNYYYYYLFVGFF